MGEIAHAIRFQCGGGVGVPAPFCYANPMRVQPYLKEASGLEQTEGGNMACQKGKFKNSSFVGHIPTMSFPWSSIGPHKLLKPKQLLRIPLCYLRTSQCAAVQEFGKRRTCLSSNLYQSTCLYKIYMHQIWALLKHLNPNQNKPVVFTII